MKIELLAPVGSMEAFKSAISSGANAIYLAGKKFGAREKATFANEELIDIIKIAHINEVKVYVTVNTLLYDDQLEEVMEFIDFLYNNDCDAIIVQDLGLLTLVHNIYPDLAIHASTQMNTMTVKQAKHLKDMGVSRIVVARETSIDLIKEIIEKVGIEVEVFAHGALCVSYSGQCLFSSCTAKKSGNRGECLQLCRLPYSLYREEQLISDNEYLLSTKDLNTIQHIGELVDANITSLKIEGRLKSGTYVGVVVRTYRKYIDNYIKQKQTFVDKKDYKDLKQAFNREFTKGYLFDEETKNITNIYRPNNMGVKIGKVVSIRNDLVTIRLNDTLNQGDGIRIVGKEDIGFYVNKMEVNKLLVNSANASQLVNIRIKGRINIDSDVYKTSDVKLSEGIDKTDSKRKFPIRVKLETFIGEKLKIEVTDNLNNKIEETSEYEVIKANNSPTSKEKIVQQISKLGETNYYLDKIEINGDEDVLIPVSIINDLRRKVVLKLDDTRRKINVRKGKQKLNLANIEVIKQPFKLKIKASNNIQYNIAKQYVEEEDIYYNDKNNTTYCYPRISENKINIANKKVLINEMHDVDTQKEMIANFYMNCTNIFSLYALYKMGFKRVTLSIEMTKERVFNLIENYKKYFKVNPNIEIVVYSKTDLMISKYCVINKCLEKDKKMCGECLTSRYYLEDRKGYKIPLIKDYFCNLRLLNPRALMLFEYVEELKEKGISCLRIEFNDESEQECKDILDSYFSKNVELDSRKFTYGYFKEKEE